LCGELHAFMPIAVKTIGLENFFCFNPIDTAITVQVSTEIAEEEHE